MAELTSPQDKGTGGTNSKSKGNVRPKGKIRQSKRMRQNAMIEALASSLGIVSSAAEAVGINRDTHYQWYNNDPEYKKAVDAIAERAIDFAETSLLKQIKEGNTSATIFYLKTKGKKRGYIETEIHVTKDVSDLGEFSDEELDLIATHGYAGYKKVSANREG